MKIHFLLLVLLGILITSGGCDRTPTGTDADGTLRATLDGEPWVGNAVVHFRGDTLLIWSTRRNVRGREQHLGLQAVEFAGSYTLITTSWTSGYSETLGGDVLTYRADATGGSISLDRVDPEEGRAVGTFRLTVAGGRGTSRFENGEFEARTYPR